MPPPVEEWSDEESGDIPFTDAPEEKKNKKDTSNTEEQEDDEEDDEEEDDEEEGVFVVEQVKKHRYEADGTLFLFVKWKGYDKIADHTWEPEIGLQEGAEDVLNAYYKKLGGRPEHVDKSAKAPGRKRKSMGEKKEAPASVEPKKPRRGRQSMKDEAKDESKADVNTPAESEEDEPSDWVPKSKNWEDEVQSVDTIIRDATDNELYALLLWNNGKRSRIAIQSCYEKCPLRMLKFYEKHLVFKDG